MQIKLTSGALTTIFLFFILSCSGFRGVCQELVSVMTDGVGKEILILPYSYNLDSALTEKGNIKVTKVKKVSADFKSQLARAAEQTAEAGGNVFMISRMRDHNQKGKYKVWGTAYYTGDFEQVKTRAIAKKTEKLENGKYAYLVVYRPSYRSGFNDDKRMVVTINDTLKLEMKGNTKYMIRLSKEGDLKIAGENDLLVQHLHVQLGKTYYVRPYINIPGTNKLIRSGENNIAVSKRQPYFETVDDLQGALESSLVNLITITKKM